MVKKESTEELIKKYGHLPCLLRKESQCEQSYRKEDVNGDFYRTCGVCASANKHMGLEKNILGPNGTDLPNWPKIDKLVLYENSPAIENIKTLLIKRDKYQEKAAFAKNNFEKTQREMTQLFLEENQDKNCTVSQL